MSKPGRHSGGTTQRSARRSRQPRAPPRTPRRLPGGLGPACAPPRRTRFRPAVDAGRPAAKPQLGYRRAPLEHARGRRRRFGPPLSTRQAHLNAERRPQPPQRRPGPCADPAGVPSRKSARRHSRESRGEGPPPPDSSSAVPAGCSRSGPGSGLDAPVPPRLEVRTSSPASLPSSASPASALCARPARVPATRRPSTSAVGSASASGGRLGWCLGPACGPGSAGARLAGGRRRSSSLGGCLLAAASGGGAGATKPDQLDHGHRLSPLRGGTLTILV
jgi:hypothetical protein